MHLITAIQSGDEKKKRKLKLNKKHILNGTQIH